MRFTDSHCHLTDRAFASDRTEVIERAREARVSRLVTIASDAQDALAARDLARATSGVWCTAGIHPHSVGSTASGGVLDALRDVAEDPRCVAIGETGLDYFYDNAPRDAQRRSFEAHVALAEDVGLPLVVHSREAEEDTIAIMGAASGRVRGVLHCFSGSLRLLEAALAAGWWVSFTGVASFKSFDPEVVRTVPADRYMIETDSPYLAPVPHRGRRNEPAWVPHVAEAVARIREESLAHVAETTWANATRFFDMGEWTPGAPGGGS